MSALWFTLARKRAKMNAKTPLPKRVRLTVRGRLSPEVEQAIREDELVCEAHENLSLAQELLRGFQGKAEASAVDDSTEETLQPTLTRAFG
jgi:hypothetical protein